MYRVKIKESVDDLQFIRDCGGLDTTTVYTVSENDNGLYEIHGFEFEEHELEFLD